MATNDDPVFIAGGNGRLYPDVGATLAALETACDRKAFRVGKPGSFGFEMMLEDHFADEREQWQQPEYLSKFCYIGDNVETDMYFSKSAGIGSVLVLSGLAQLDSHAEEIQRANPSFILDRFATSE